MEKDMKYGVRGPILGTRPKPDFTTEGENARLAKTITILMDTNAELLAALERFVDIHSTGSTGLCIFCTKHRTKHTPECPMTQARAALAKARKGGGE